MPKRSSKLRDPNELASAIVEEATNDTPGSAPDKGKNPHAVALGRLGGQVGGRARADKLSPERRAEIARNAARARWERES